ncbi:hypothetical protein J3R30DRAFT_3429124, partial [Lentinula aciculospora]
MESDPCEAAGSREFPQNPVQNRIFERSRLTQFIVRILCRLKPKDKILVWYTLVQSFQADILRYGTFPTSKNSRNAGIQVQTFIEPSTSLRESEQGFSVSFKLVLFVTYERKFFSGESCCGICFDRLSFMMDNSTDLVAFDTSSSCGSSSSSFLGNVTPCLAAFTDVQVLHVALVMISYEPLL